MKHQLVSPHELAPPSVMHLPIEKRIERWVEVYDAAEQFLLAGLRERIGKDGDMRAAYREWYARRMEEHDRTMAHMIVELRRREALSCPAK
jgi:hypothetical protein